MALFHAGKDSMIEKMFIEPEEPGDPFKVSDAETMLNPQATKPKCVPVHEGGCPFVPVPRRC